MSGRFAEAAKQTIKEFIKRTLKRSIKGFLIANIPVVVIVLLMVLVVAIIYGTMTANTYMTGVYAAPEDKAIVAYYQQLASTDWKGKPAWNVNDTYLVQNESFGGKPFYVDNSHTGPGENLHFLADNDRTDQSLILKWSTIHAVCLYWQFVTGAEKIPDELRDQVARDLHPYFYYIKRTDTITYS